MRGARRFFSREKQVFLVGFSLTIPRFPHKSKNRLNASLIHLQLISVLYFKKPSNGLVHISASQWRFPNPPHPKSYQNPPLRCWDRLFNRKPFIIIIFNLDNPDKSLWVRAIPLSAVLHMSVAPESRKYTQVLSFKIACLKISLFCTVRLSS